MDRPLGQFGQDQTIWRAFRKEKGKDKAAKCLSSEDLASYIDRKTSLAQTESIEAHLSVCQECLSAVREIRSLVNDVGQSAPAQVVERARQLVAEEDAQERLTQQEGFFSGLRSLFKAPLEGMAYVFLMVLVSTVGLKIGTGTYRDLYSAQVKAMSIFPSPLGEELETSAAGGGL